MTNDRLARYRPAHRQRGIVIIIVLLALLLLAALVFYVMNLGREVNARIVTQHAADVSAQAGAGWVARSMNTVAMNNVEMSKHIAAVNVLDSLPLAIDLTVKDETEDEIDDLEALRIAVPAQLRQGVSDAWFEAALRSMTFVVEQDDQDLSAIDDYFRNNPDVVINMTHYSAPGAPDGRGHLWRAMAALDDISRATMDNVQMMAILNAHEGGMANLPRSGPRSQDAFATALVGELPWQRGRFADFERPVLNGLLPEDVDDTQTNRGPYDAVFGWRWTNGSSGGPGSIGGPGTPPVMGPPSPGRPATRYTVYGTQSWMVDRIARHDYQRLRFWVSRLANIKARYIFPRANNNLQSVIDPAWEVDIANDNERSQDANSESVYGIAGGDVSRIRETLFVVSEIKSRTFNNPGSPAQQGVTWNYIRRPGTPRPFLLYRGGWRDPRNRPPMPMRSASPTTYTQINDHIWRLSGTYMTDPLSATLGGDPEISLPPKRAGTDAQGNPLYAAQEIYWVMDFMLVGVNAGLEIEVRNPYAGFDPSSQTAPAPIDLIHAQLPHDDAFARREHLTVYAVARQNDAALFWPSAFDAGKPYPHTVAVAQATVFNNHSWDMWTQMWHAKLVPVTGFDQWNDAMTDYPSGAPGQADLSDIAQYLEAIEPLSDLMLNH